tara:strand:- start:498 stop:806 length:309 start_codon:yes stop_codon:yes gene_type:complete
MSKGINEIKLQLIKAGKTAALELVKVANKTLVTDLSSEDDLALDKLKNAAAAKKMAIFDAFDILDRIRKEEDNMEDEAVPGEKPKKKIVEKPVDFKSAEERA